MNSDCPFTVVNFARSAGAGVDFDEEAGQESSEQMIKMGSLFLPLRKLIAIIGFHVRLMYVA